MRGELDTQSRPVSRGRWSPGVAAVATGPTVGAGDDTGPPRAVRSRRRPLAGLVTAVVLVAGWPGAATAAAPNVTPIEVTTGLAPVQADGLTVGAPTDFVVTWADPDPSVPGLDLRRGATVTLTLPEEFVDTGVRVAAGSAPGCGPPLVVDCSTAVLVQGWPQSPVLPFPDVEWEESSGSFVLTLLADAAPAPPQLPGAKTLHVQAFGFRNPDRPGTYVAQLEIRPDPATDEVLVADAPLRIRPRTSPHIGVLSTVNGAPPPPFPNSVFQTASLEDGPPELLVWGLYLWGVDAEPLVGARVRMHRRDVGLVLDGDGRPVGHVRVRAPAGAVDHSLETQPSVARRALLSGQPTALMLAHLRPDPGATGAYEVTFSLHGGTTQTLVVTVE